MKILIFSLFFFCLSIAQQQYQWKPNYLGKLDVAFNAYNGLIATNNSNVSKEDKYTLYISTFDYTNSAQDYVYHVKSPGRQLNNISQWELTLIDKQAFWPNDMYYMPNDLIAPGSPEGIIWTSGFLFKRQGALNVYYTNTDPLDGPYNISGLDTTGYAYHKAIWHDVNKDGNVDVVAARFQYGPIIDKHMLWFENPGDGRAHNWTQHLIMEGPDVAFTFANFTANNRIYFVTIVAEYWNKRLVLYYAEDGTDILLRDPSKATEVLIDNIGEALSVYAVDLNMDGKAEILVGSWNESIEEGFVYAYEVPDLFWDNTSYVRHVIADGIITDGSNGYMAPGKVDIFYTGKIHEESGDKPYVLVSGDDEGSFYILEPQSQDQNNWNYTKHLLIDSNNTIVGDFSVADLDGDGWNEIVAAGYSAGELYVFSYGTTN